MSDPRGVIKGFRAQPQSIPRSGPVGHAQTNTIEVLLFRSSSHTFAIWEEDTLALCRLPSNEAWCLLDVVRRA